jgi:hypothetical protein
MLLIAMMSFFLFAEFLFQTFVSGESFEADQKRYEAGEETRSGF